MYIHFWVVSGVWEFKMGMGKRLGAGVKFWPAGVEGRDMVYLYEMLDVNMKLLVDTDQVPYVFFVFVFAADGATPPL
jgi:hypothetical protein